MQEPTPGRRSSIPLRLGRPWVVVMGILGVLGIGILDAKVLPAGLGLAPFYAIFVFWVGYRTGWLWGALLAFLSAFLWITAERVAGLTYARPWLLYWNAAIRLCFFLVVAAFSVNRRSLETERRRATTDLLTGLLNRRGFLEKGDLELNLCRRHGHVLTVLYADCDNFKAVNDTLGHDAGNLLLKDVGRVILQETRSFEVAARLGGDEFAMLLPETGERQARLLVERLRKSLREAMHAGRWPVTFSLGVATFPSPPASLGEALKESDRLMYRAKNRGKDTTEYAILDAS